MFEKLAFCITENGYFKDLHQHPIIPSAIQVEFPIPIVSIATPPVSNGSGQEEPRLPFSFCFFLPFTSCSSKIQKVLFRILLPKSSLRGRNEGSCPPAQKVAGG